ncbi:helix-turn-helix transcriptional regulator [Gemmatimonadota bacterium]
MNEICATRTGICTINLRMKLARIEQELSQQGLADLIGVTRQTIGLIEKGRYNPSLNLCLRIARALNKTLDQLFWEDSDV